MVEGTASRSGLLSALGPGVLFTGAAVGVSHLVQATRAGAVYGFGLLVVVVLANLAKYPAFRFGPQYAVATHRSLLEGYRRQGSWALAVYGVLTVGTMFTVEAAVTLVTAGLAKFLLGIDVSPLLLSAVLLGACAGLIAAGKYHWLDRISKVVVSVLALSTIVATVLALPTIDWEAMTLWPDRWDAPTIFFVAALAGWMPSAIDVAVWQSLWTLAREKDSGHRPSMWESMFDFHLGYWGTAFLAICFLALGAGVMHGSGEEFADSAGGFAAQVIDLYARALGEWSRPIIAAAAFATMFSTTLTVVDGFPRALSVLFSRFRGPEAPGGADEAHRSYRVVYWGSMIALAAGSLVIVGLLLSSLKSMVDLATTLSLLTAPILAWLNHRAVLGPEVPEEMRPTLWLVVASWLGIAALGAVALYCLWLELVP